MLLSLAIVSAFIGISQRYKDHTYGEVLEAENELEKNSKDLDALAHQLYNWNDSSTSNESLS